MFSKLPSIKADRDGIMAMMRAVALDNRPNKVDLTVGLYKNELGETPLMQAVRQADCELSIQRSNKAYVLPTGTPDFMQAMKELAFGPHAQLRPIEGVQTPGASGALYLILNTIKFADPGVTVWVSDPTYLNHIPTIQSIGLSWSTYPFLNRSDMSFQEEAFYDWLKTLGPRDVVIFHGCCHNPSGVKISAPTWMAVAEAAERLGFLPIFDTAYQGLGDGIEEDAMGLRLVTEKVERLALSISCSKSFGLYSDRVGCAFVLGQSQDEAKLTQAYLSLGSRPTYWVPPNNGAEIVAKILTSDELRRLWMKELADIRHRVGSLREDLTLALQNATQSDRFDSIRNQTGMFTMLPFSSEQMRQLYRDYAIYGLEDGRINIAALRESRIAYVAEGIASVFRAPHTKISLNS